MLPSPPNRGRTMAFRTRPAEAVKLAAACIACEEHFSEWARRVLLAEASRVLNPSPELPRKDGPEDR